MVGSVLQSISRQDEESGTLAEIEVVEASHTGTKDALSLAANCSSLNVSLRKLA